MTDEDKQPKADSASEDEPQPPKIANPTVRSAPTRRDNTEKGLALEMARLFGMSPKQMMAPKAKLEKLPEAAERREESDGAPLDVGEPELPGGGEGQTEE